MRVTLSDRNSNVVWFKGSESLLSGAGAGLVTSIVTCPLDVVKTKLQAAGKSSGGVRGVFDRIWSQDGFRGLYRGLGPTIFGYLPTWAIYFTVYDRVKQTMGTLRANDDDPIVHIVAAMTAGATGSIVTNPLWVIKTRFMTQDPSLESPRYKHTLDAIVTIYKNEGVRAFYRGLVPSLIGVSHIAVQFPLYERLKVYYRPENGDPISSSDILFCSSSSKMIASVATYPHEVLRTRLQIQKFQRLRGLVEAGFTTSEGGPNSTFSSNPKITTTSIPVAHGINPIDRGAAGITGKEGSKAYEGISITFGKILREEGVRGFYRGMGINLLRTVPSSALTILTYEVLMRRLMELSHPELYR